MTFSATLNAACGEFSTTCWLHDLLVDFLGHMPYYILQPVYTAAQILDLEIYQSQQMWPAARKKAIHTWLPYQYVSVHEPDQTDMVSVHGLFEMAAAHLCRVEADATLQNHKHLFTVLATAR